LGEAADVSTWTMLAMPAFGLVLGVLGRLIVPRPGVLSCLFTGLVGLVGAVLGLVLGGLVGLDSVVSAVTAALFVALACGWAAFRRGPYPPHDRAPRSFDPEERVRERRAAARRRGLG
jgi:uncharacterized membrane protein YeaQ/YmgE (transglycosylase-associated protein family)